MIFSLKAWLKTKTCCLTSSSSSSEFSVFRFCSVGKRDPVHRWYLMANVSRVTCACLILGAVCLGLNLCAFYGRALSGVLMCNSFLCNENLLAVFLIYFKVSMYMSQSTSALLHIQFCLFPSLVAVTLWWSHSIVQLWSKLNHVAQVQSTTKDNTNVMQTSATWQNGEFCGKGVTGSSYLFVVSGC